MLKRALISYVSNSVKAIWSAVAHPLVIEGSKNCNVKDYRIYGSGDGIVGAGGVIPITVRGKNYFDLAKVPFSNSTTEPYNNGLKAEKTSGDNRGDKIPISLPVGKTIYLTLDVVDSQIAGTTARVSLGFYNSDDSRIREQRITSGIAHKTYSLTLSEEVKYIQFYFQSNSSSNAVGDYVTMDNIMFRTEGEDVWEAYIKPQTVEIVSGIPLVEGTSIQKSADGLPDLPQFKGTTVYEAQTEIPPSGIAVQYYG
jgi:hypothetical protein